MIIHLKDGLTQEEIQNAADATQAIILNGNGVRLITPAKMKEPPTAIEPWVDSFHPTASDIQLASRGYSSDTRAVTIGDVTIGGATGNSVVVTGPCSVESREQIFNVAEFVTKLGLKTIRAGCFKPRTSPYSFQGMGIEGLRLLAEVREQFKLCVFTEVRDATHVDAVIEHTDVIQIGAKSMYDHGILKACAKTTKPVLLKRGFGSTLQEFVQCAEFILSGGNPNVILCERGIRAFEPKTRFTLDLCGVSYLKEHVNLPIILDPSHAMGHAYGVGDLSRSCMAMGVDGLIIETHPNPKAAKSDAAQQLNFDQFEQLLGTLTPVAGAVGKQVV